MALPALDPEAPPDLSAGGAGVVPACPVPAAARAGVDPDAPLPAPAHAQARTSSGRRRVSFVRFMGYGTPSGPRGNFGGERPLPRWCTLFPAWLRPRLRGVPGRLVGGRTPS